MKGHEVKHYGLISADIDHDKRIVVLIPRPEGNADLGRQGRERCMSWALVALKPLTDSGYVIAG